MFYVYSLINPIDNKIFYIGMGRGKRMFKHVQLAKNHKVSNNNYRLYDTIQNILNAGFQVRYEIIKNNLEFKEALLLESKKIKEIGLENLTNLNNGGTGRPPGYKHTMETRQKIAKSNTGKIKSEKTRRLIGLSKIGNKNMLGKSLSDEAKNKISKANKGKTNRALQYEGFISPTGEVYSPIINLQKFCREHGLTRALMHAVIIKQQTHHKGWKLYERKHAENQKS